MNCERIVNEFLLCGKSVPHAVKRHLQLHREEQTVFDVSSPKLLFNIGELCSLFRNLGCEIQKNMHWLSAEGKRALFSRQLEDALLRSEVVHLHDHGSRRGSWT